MHGGPGFDPLQHMEDRGECLSEKWEGEGFGLFPSHPFLVEVISSFPMDLPPKVSALSPTDPR